MSEDRIYRVTFVNQEKVFEIYAKSVTESEMFGFLEVAEFVFGENTTVVVDPSEEELKREFKDVRCSYIPTHSVVRIDEVSKEGTAKIRESKGANNNISYLPDFRRNFSDK